eukprot:SAG31_NODE_234_length_19701_cov_16.835068_8_plen_152_part_00
MANLLEIGQRAATCAVCGTSFPSRNKLHRHLEESGHGVIDGRTLPGASGRLSSQVTSSQDEADLRSGPTLDNHALHDYYRQQKICSKPEQWQAAYDTFKIGLPLAVRVSLSSPAGLFFAKLLSRHAEVNQVGWYPTAGGVGALEVRLDPAR